MRTINLIACRQTEASQGRLSLKHESHHLDGMCHPGLHRPPVWRQTQPAEPDHHLSILLSKREPKLLVSLFPSTSVHRGSMHPGPTSCQWDPPAHPADCGRYELMNAWAALPCNLHRFAAEYVCVSPSSQKHTSLFKVPSHQTSHRVCASSWQ